MEELLYKETLVYIDDLIIFSETFEEHLESLEKVLQKLRKAKLKINGDKSKFGYKKIEFLGHCVGERGIEVNDGKIEVVKNFPRPKNISELRRFIGMVSYYRRFIKDFSKIAKPLTRLFKDGRREKIEKGKSKKQNKFKREKYKCENCQKKGHYEEESFEEMGKWEDEQEISFQLLKEKLITAPILRHPDFNKEFWVNTDASGGALGAILKQKENNDKDEYVIEYASKSLTEAEQKWTTTEQECYAIIWAMRKFHYYLAGRKFKVITDHSALKWLKKNAHKGKKARWFEEIQEYDFEVIHKEGKSHKDVDALLRIRWENNGKI
jgi:RNase H-like domain found in reverse transcriptase/Reverse transcriptase (RNA-dependent DNA polymerase)